MLRNSKPLVVFGCCHIGHKDCDYSLLQKYVDYVKKNNAYALLLSDNFENAIPKKASMMWSQNLTPEEQLDYATNLFRPIRKSIIGACSGNHTARTSKEAGFDLDRELAVRLGYLNRYYQHQGFITTKIGSQRYSIAFKHGTGVGSNVFGNCIVQHRSYPSADLCCASHTHLTASTKLGFWDIIKGKRAMHQVTLVNTGSMLDYPDYADSAYYPPQPKSFAIVHLGAKEKKITVDVNGLC